MSETLHDAITRLLREKSEQTNMIETIWLLFAKAVPIPPGGVQWVESRRCFFAGALTLFEAVVSILDEDAEPTEADLRRVDRIAQELQRFGNDLRQGLA